jgi:ATP-dependent DNA helicase RecG
MGNSNIRNPILLSYIAKGILPYKGIGSGIKRALDKWKDIELINNQEGCLFTVIIKIREIFVSGKMSGKIMSHKREDAEITIPELASLFGATCSLFLEPHHRKN